MPEVLEPMPWPEGKDIVLFTTRAEDYNDNMSRLVSALRTRHGHGVIVTANRPHAVLRQNLDAAGVDLDGVEFVDCISAVTGQHPRQEEGVTFIDGPLLLEMIALRAQQLARFMPDGDRFMVIDSLSTLKLYNGQEAVEEMTHNLSTRLRLLGVTTAFLALQDGGAGPFLNTVSSYCDDLVTL